MSINPKELINKSLYQVFILSCPCSLPISFARHNWFVINKKGTLSRWEVLFQKDCCGKSWAHLYLNAKDPFESLGIFSVRGASFWQPKLLGYIEGDAGSEAEKVAAFIENSHNTYPYCYKYLFWGPNSNTYTQWVLNHFSEFKVKLPWNSFGKNKIT